jgi:hypothetical protein
VYEGVNETYFYRDMTDAKAPTIRTGKDPKSKTKWDHNVPKVTTTQRDYLRKLPCRGWHKAGQRRQTGTDHSSFFEHKKWSPSGKLGEVSRVSSLGTAVDSVQFIRTHLNRQSLAIPVSPAQFRPPVF